MKRLHPLDMESDARCWTCNKPFTKRQLLYQHFSTVQQSYRGEKKTMESEAMVIWQIFIAIFTAGNLLRPKH